MLVKLDDVVDRITGNEDRLETKLPYYLGGEHYESESIAIYDKGIIKSEAGAKLGFKFHFPFKKGDTIFMSRNAHLKKAGMVTYDGICSDTSYILRTKDEKVLLGRYLPLVIQNDKFWQFFEENKSGSVNYLLNWKEMKEFEFELPSIDKQREIAELAWAIEHTRQMYNRLLVYTQKLMEAQFIDIFGSLKMEKRSLKSVCTNGPQNGFYRKGAEDNGAIPVIKMKELFGNECMEEADDCALVSVTQEELNRFRLTEFDLLFGRRSLVIEGAGKCSRVGQVNRDMVFDSSLLRVSLNPAVVRPRFVQMWLKTPEGVNAITSIRAVTTIAGIKGSDLAKITIPIPPLEKQDEFIALLKRGDTSVKGLKETISDLSIAFKHIVADRVGGEDNV